MKVYKYKERSSSGTAKDWTYIIVPNWVGNKKGECSIKEYLESEDLLGTWSEHYRGVICKKVYKPPLNILESEIDSTRIAIEDKKEDLRQLNELKKKFYKK